MNTKQLIDIAKEYNCFWIWKYSNGQRIWAEVDKSIQLDKQRKHFSDADM